MPQRSKSDTAKESPEQEQQNWCFVPASEEQGFLMLQTPETQIQSEELREEPKSFDVMASVNMLRFDLENFGSILPETKQRSYDEELTFVAEGINRPLYTNFNLKEKDGQLVYFNDGEWQPYISSLVSGLDTAKKEAQADPRKSFLVDMRAFDLEIGYGIEGLAPGESLRWCAKFPEEENKTYGRKFLKEECGLHPERKMGFVYKATKNFDGSLNLESHSVDNSDTDAFEAAMQSDDNSDIKDMVEAYDATLSQKHGKEFSAGRDTGGISEENAWEVLQANEDLVEWYFARVEELATLVDSPELEDEKVLLTFGFWAAIKKRMDRDVGGAGIETAVYTRQNFPVPTSQEVLAEEVKRATIDLANKGEQLIGCGGSVSVKALSEQSPDNVLDEVFGEEKQPWYGRFKKKNKECVNCREEKEEVGEKDWCEKCIGGHCGKK